MTTMNEARDAVYKRAIAEWPVGDYAAVPYCFDDETLDPPVDPVTNRKAPWVRFSVRNLSGGQQTLGAPGNRKFTRSAIVRAEVFTAPGTGQKDPDLMCQKALGMFEARYLAGALVYDGRAQEIGLVDEDRWKLSTVQVSFDYEEIK